MRVSIEYKLATGLLIVFFLVLAFAITTRKKMNSVVGYNEKQNQSQLIISSVNKTRTALLEIEASSRGFVLTNDPLFLIEYNENVEKENRSWLVLTNLLKDDPLFIRKKSGIEKLIRSRIVFADSVIRIRKSSGLINSTKLIASARGNELTEKIIRDINELENYQYVTTKLFNTSESAAANRTIYLFSILIGLILIVLVIIFILFKKDLSWRRKSRNEFKALNESLELKVLERVKELARSELKYRFLTEHTVDVISLNDIQGRYIYISDSVTKILGFIPSEMIGKSAFDFIHPDDIALLKNRYEDMSPRTSVDFFQFRHKTKEGNYTWLESIADFTFDDHENVSGRIINTRDISQRKKFEQELIESQFRMSAILENTMDSIWSIDNQYKLIAFNKKYHEIASEFNSVEVKLGMKVWDNLEHESQILWKGLYERAIGAGERFTIELMEFYKGSEHINEISFNPILGDGKVLGAAIFAHEVTEKKRNARLLVENQQMLQNMMDNTSSVIFVKDLGGNYIMVNRKFEKVNKVSNADIVGMTDHYYLPGDVAEAVIAADKRVLETESLIELEEYIPLEDGIHTFLATKFPLYDSENKVYAICGIATDITLKKMNELELIESSARMNAVLENSSDSIWSVDKDLKLISFNNSYFESTKLFFDIEAYRGMPMLDHLNPESKERWSKLYERALKGEHFSEETEDISIGLELFFDISFNPIIVNNEITGVAIFARDISSRKNIERQLEYKVKELNTFMYKATHDLRSPLVSVMGLVQLAKDQTTDEELLKYFDMIDLSVHKMDNLLIDLVKIVNVSQGKLVSENLDFNSIIDDILISLSHYPEFSEIVFKRQIHSDTTFKSDRRLLYSVFQNLIDNAIKYKKPLSVTEPVIIITVNIAPEQVQIGITDNGIGIPDGVKDRVFEMFYRGNSSPNGTGLGLYIVKTSVEKLGGKIMLSSIEGKGTSINIIIPNA